MLLASFTTQSTTLIPRSDITVKTLTVDSPFTSTDEIEVDGKETSAVRVYVNIFH